LHEVFVTKWPCSTAKCTQVFPVSKSLQIATKPHPFVTDNPAPVSYTACIVNRRRTITVKYATVMTTGLLVNISIFASDMPATENYAELMGNKQRIIKQLSKQVECVRLAIDNQQLKACQSTFNQVKVRTINPEKLAQNAQKLKADNPKQQEFF
jgi:hypothetical protein